jgi:hypothetical protein
MAERFRQKRTRLIESDEVDPSVVPLTFEEFQAQQEEIAASDLPYTAFLKEQVTAAEEALAAAEKERQDNPSAATARALAEAKENLSIAKDSLTTGTDLSDLSKTERLGFVRDYNLSQELEAREESKPTEDPGEGNIWSYSVRDGMWKKVFVGAGFTGGGSGFTGGGSGFTGGGNGGYTGSSSTGATTYTAPDGKMFTDLNAYNAYIAQTGADAKTKAGQSAYDLLFAEFDRYGLGALVEPLKGFITQGLSQAEFTLRLRQTDAYQKRFAANAQRIKAGLRALSEAEYIGLEDQYQNVMRNYGLPKEYYARGDMGIQQGFEKFIAGDVSAAELEDRIQTAQNRVINAAPEVGNALREFYPDITNGDILAYALDPDKALSSIKRKVTAAEIGAGAMMAGLATGLARAEELQRYGVTGDSARQGFQTIGSFLPRASQLGEIYAKSGMGPYTQTTAEAEVFGTPGAIEAEKKRRQLAQLEQAQFSGQTGAAGGALARERAGQF